MNVEAEFLPIDSGKKGKKWEEVAQKLNASLYNMYCAKAVRQHKTKNRQTEGFFRCCFLFATTNQLVPETF